MTDFADLIDLASERLGGRVLHTSDDFFAPAENLLRAGDPISNDAYTDRGKWMDGWESRRRRDGGHDFAIIRLGAPGVIRGVIVDTRFFRGNFPAHCSIEAIAMRPETSVATLMESSDWQEILPKSALEGDSINRFEIATNIAATHLRLHIFPDGGVARLRVHGDPVPDWHREGGLANEQDLAAAIHGGRVLDCSDMFFGPRHNLVLPGPSVSMADGWETRRRRGPGHDWVTVRLACEATIRRIEIDTSHFKGNFPDTCSIDARNESEDWIEILPRTPLLPDTRHVFSDELLPGGAVSELRLNVYPDGGVARLRAWGRATDRGRGEAVTRFLNTRTVAEAERQLLRCCASEPWARKMAATRPFPSWDSVSVMADRIWWGLDQTEWLEAFAAHPRIGESDGGAWSEQEQAGMDDAEIELRTALVQLNRDYEDRFGHIFLVCAAGKSAPEMIQLLEERMRNAPVDELRIASEEQRKITQLRLLKLVD